MAKYQFQKARKEQMKARVAISGPAGSGKTTDALLFAQSLADGGSIAVIDTERKSASLYSDRFSFDSLDFQAPYDPRLLVEAIDAAAEAGYAVLVIDSLSHFWAGEGGLLEFVDKAGGGNKFTNGWGQATPLQNRMIEKILSFPGHVVVTMRSKVAYAVEQDSRGKSVPRKIGQAPIQREGVEYEFTLVLDIDRDHSIGISKTRCTELETTGFVPGSELHNMIETFVTWLNDGDAATLPSKQAKQTLFQAVQDRGWTGDDAKNIAKDLWAGANVTGERVPQSVIDEMLRNIPRHDVEVDPFAIDEEEVSA